jgi:hypothetical protein
MAALAGRGARRRGWVASRGVLGAGWWVDVMAMVVVMWGM